MNPFARALLCAAAMLMAFNAGIATERYLTRCPERPVAAEDFHAR